MKINNTWSGLQLCGAVFAGLPAQTLALTAAESAKKDEIIRVPGDDAAMTAAFRRARASLDGFVRLLDAPPAGTESYAVKIRVSEGGFNEYFWIGNLKREGSRFSGTLNNTPRQVKSVQAGQVVRFGRDEIYDWTYVDRAQKRMMGNFTACALLTHESPESAAQFKQQYGLVCD
jgi:uncharacterized protein YegJ (DUF2314 family)